VLPIHLPARTTPAILLARSTQMIRERNATTLLSAGQQRGRS
jgi:hypothetical protein